jgi:hypothetical protein
MKAIPCFSGCLLACKAQLRVDSFACAGKFQWREQLHVAATRLPKAGSDGKVLFREYEKGNSLIATTCEEVLYGPVAESLSCGIWEVGKKTH